MLKHFVIRNLQTTLVAYNTYTTNTVSPSVCVDIAFAQKKLRVYKCQCWYFIYVCRVLGPMFHPYRLCSEKNPPCLQMPMLVLYLRLSNSWTNVSPYRLCSEKHHVYKCQCWYFIYVCRTPGPMFHPIGFAQKKTPCLQMPMLVLYLRLSNSWTNVSPYRLCSEKNPPCLQMPMLVLYLRLSNSWTNVSPYRLCSEKKHHVYKCQCWFFIYVCRTLGPMFHPIGFAQKNTMFTNANAGTLSTFVELLDQCFTL